MVMMKRAPVLQCCHQTRHWVLFGSVDQISHSLAAMPEYGRYRKSSSCIILHSRIWIMSIGRPGGCEGHVGRDCDRATTLTLWESGSSGAIHGSAVLKALHRPIAGLIHDAGLDARRLCSSPADMSRMFERVLLIPRGECHPQFTSAPESRRRLDKGFK